MQIWSIRTSIYLPQTNILDFLFKHLEPHNIQDGDIIAITSKIISLAENRLISKNAVTSKKELVIKEADYFLGGGAYDCYLTIKHNLFIPSAGIDESNSPTGDYILYPENPMWSCQQIWGELRKEFKVKKLGVILTDSHTTPLRRGVTGIALAHAGFHGTSSKVGQNDLFDKQLQFTHINHADALASMAVYKMGEANEQCPLAIIRGASEVPFTLDSPLSCAIENPEWDLYYPLFASLLTTSSISGS